MLSRRWFLSAFAALPFVKPAPSSAAEARAFTTTGTWIKPAGSHSTYVTVIACGGGSGGALPSSH